MLIFQLKVEFLYLLNAFLICGLFLLSHPVTLLVGCRGCLHF